MSEADVIGRSGRPVLEGTIIEGLYGLGIKADDILLVHTSLSSLGWVAGGAVTVINALLAVIGARGTLVMPAFTGEYSDPADWHSPPVPDDWHDDIRREMPAFHPDRTPTRGVGAVAECFRAWPGTVRSGHPNTSFCALGPLARELTTDHPLDHGMGDRSPLGRLHALDARVLLIGCGFEACSGFHLAESRLAQAEPRRIPMAIARAPVFSDGRRGWALFSEPLYDDRDFGQLGAAFKAEHDLGSGRIGNAECHLFALRDAVDFASKWLILHRKKDG